MILQLHSAVGAAGSRASPCSLATPRDMLPLQTVVALGLYLSGAPLQHSSSSAASRAAVVRAQSSSAPVVGLDVVELTKDFLKSASGYYSPVDASKLDEAFVFRAPTIGPLNKKDYMQTMTNLQTYVGFPDLTPNAFGFTVDPDDELKCIFWTRATGTFSQPWNPYGAKLEALTIPPTGATARLPTECYSITYTPEGKVKYLTAGYVVNKLEGNTAGYGAVLALFVAAGKTDMVNLALNENVRSVGNWLANNVDSSVAKTQSNTDELPRWYASVEPPPPA